MHRDLQMHTAHQALPIRCDEFAILPSYLPRHALAQWVGKVLRVLNNHSRQSLGFALLDIHSLHVRIQLLLCTFLVVSLSRDAHAQPEGDAFDAGLPDFLVELRVETDVEGALGLLVGLKLGEHVAVRVRTMAKEANFRISLIARGARFLKATPWTCCAMYISLPSIMLARRLLG